MENRVIILHIVMILTITYFVDNSWVKFLTDS